MKRFNILSILLAFSSIAFSQNIADSTYWYFFTDKNNNDFEISQPLEFLSQRSVDRRAWQSLPVDQTDLPITSAYTDSLRSLGLDILHVSKWLNGVLFSSVDTPLLDTIHKLSFLSSEPWSPSSGETFTPESPVTSRFELPYETNPDYSYGYSKEQIEQVNIDFLHQKGYTGKGVIISILDGGFMNMPDLSSLETAYNNDQILETRDFVTFTDTVYHSHSHGTHVSSVILSYEPDYLIGTAPDAQLILARTENGDSETRIEEYAWIAAAEWADSMGTDVINTSLGYTEFDDPATNYTYDDMNGKTAHISIANSMTAAKGIISVTSAGNSGNDPWYYIGAPADATDILSVGAVNTEGFLAAFSSRGPSVDQRVKPEIAATGSNTALQAFTGSFSYASGTSFSSPLIAGATAVLWQAYPSMPAKDLIKWIIESSDQYENPDADFGYGIPSFIAAYYAITGINENINSAELKAYPNPFTTNINIEVTEKLFGSYQFKLYNTQGRIIESREVNIPGNIHFETDMPSGLYFMEMKNENHILNCRIIKN